MMTASWVFIGQSVVGSCIRRDHEKSGRRAECPVREGGAMRYLNVDDGIVPEAVQDQATIWHHIRCPAGEPALCGEGVPIASRASLLPASRC